MDILMSAYLQTEHGQVVALLCSIGMAGHFRLHELDGVLARDEGVSGKQTEDVLVAELLLKRVLSLVQPVGIEEERLADDIVEGFALKLYV